MKGRLEIRMGRHRVSVQSAETPSASVGQLATGKPVCLGPQGGKPKREHVEVSHWLHLSP